MEVSGNLSVREFHFLLEYSLQLWMAAAEIAMYGMAEIIQETKSNILEYSCPLYFSGYPRYIMKEYNQKPCQRDTTPAKKSSLKKINSDLIENLKDK